MSLTFSRMVKMKPGYSDREIETNWSHLVFTNKPQYPLWERKDFSQSAGWNTVTGITLTVHQRPNERETESVNNLSETGRCVWECSLIERGKSISGKLKLLILLDLQPIKIYHACLHVGMLFFLAYLREKQDNVAWMTVTGNNFSLAFLKLFY